MPKATMKESVNNDTVEYLNMFSSNEAPKDGPSFSGGLDLSTGDKVEIMLTDILPDMTEKKEVEENTPLGEDWKQYANFNTGLLCVFTVLRKKTPQGEEIIAVNKETGDLLKGKFGLQIYHKVSLDGLFGKNQDRDFEVDCKFGDKIVKYPIKSLPAIWPNLTPKQKYDIWMRFAALTIKCNDDYPIVEKDNKGAWLFRMDTVEPLTLGSVGQCYIYKHEYNGKTYKFLKTYVKDPLNDKKWLSVTYYRDQLNPELATKINNKINEPAAQPLPSEEPAGTTPVGEKVPF